MKCDRVLRLLSSYLDRQLGAADRAELERHLERCRPCQDELDQLRADQQVLQAVETAPPPPYLRTRVMAEIRSRATSSAPRPAWARVLAIAATVVVVAGSACAGVALGSSFARNVHHAQFDTLYGTLPQEGQ